MFKTKLVLSPQLLKPILYFTLLKPQIFESSLIPLFLSHSASNQSGNPIDSTFKMAPEFKHILLLPLFQNQNPILDCSNSFQLAGFPNYTYPRFLTDCFQNSHCSHFKGWIRSCHFSAQSLVIAHTSLKVKRKFLLSL